MPNGNASKRILLGTAGWERPDWRDAYYPADLPAEWRLAYYANDCDCLLLSAAEWCGGDRGQLGEALAEAPNPPLLFLEPPAAARPESCGELAMFAPHRVVLLMQRRDERFDRFPQWVARGRDAWVDEGSSAMLQRWVVDAFDLRELSGRVAGLPADVSALILDGPGAQPGKIRELRLLLELMDRG
jgi:hypothetical protein